LASGVSQVVDDDGRRDVFGERPADGAGERGLDQRLGDDREFLASVGRSLWRYTTTTGTSD
jgi:hypothetical protein